MAEAAPFRGRVRQIGDCEPPICRGSGDFAEISVSERLSINEPIRHTFNGSRP